MGAWDMVSASYNYKSHSTNHTEEWAPLNCPLTHTYHKHFFNLSQFSSLRLPRAFPSIVLIPSSVEKYHNPSSTFCSTVQEKWYQSSLFASTHFISHNLQVLSDPSLWKLNFLGLLYLFCIDIAFFRLRFN